MSPYKNVETLAWVDAGEFSRSWLRMIDQTLLPVELKILDCRTIETVWEAIKMLRVRGAPAIGIAAAYGLCVGLQPLLVDGAEPSDLSTDTSSTVKPFSDHTNPIAQGIMAMIITLQSMQQAVILSEIFNRPKYE